MRVLSVIVLIAGAVGVAMAQQLASLTPLSIPSTVKGTFDRADSLMPKDVDKGAKAGPVTTMSFVVDKSTRVRIMLECDSCLPRLVLQHTGGSVITRNDGWVTAFIDAKLDPGPYTVWAGSSPSREGDYALTISDSEIFPKLSAFTEISAAYQAGTKTVKANAAVRVGSKSVTVQRNYSSEIFKSFWFSDIVAVESATASKTDVGAVLMFGPGFGASSDRWITIRTADDYVVLNVPAKSYQLLLTELQRAIAKK